MKKTVLLILSVIILCTACAAQAAEGELPVFTSIRDALDSTEGYAEIREHEDYIVLILEMDDRYIRMVVLPDDHAKELYRAVDAEHSSAAMEAFDEYAWTLPLSYTEELPEKPMSQAELDGLKGKTFQELMDGGFGREMILPESEVEAPAAICLEYGFYRYEFEVDHADSGDPRIMTIRSGKFDGLSRSAFDPDGQEILSGLQ